MSQKLWFKTKTYGYGWVPSAWQGWVTLLLFVFASVSAFLCIDGRSHSVSDTLETFIPLLIALLVLLLSLCILKGEKPRWRWGNN